MAMSSPKLLLNAEPFGFGPTAAIAEFFPHLRAHFETIGYIGSGHSLDLQRDLGYDAIHDISDLSGETLEAEIKGILPNYDILLSAMDKDIIQQAQNLGLTTYYYDALSWYWPTIPDAVKACDLYMGQNFFGVEERLSQEFNDKIRAEIVSPIISDKASDKDKRYILINLGGLQNSYWPLADVVAFSKTMIRAIKAHIPVDENLIIASSHAVASHLEIEGFKSYSRDAMKAILSQTKMAFMTSGLGNIYDAAAYNVPTIWLPPTNDSQGQQLSLLRSRNMADEALDWSRFMGLATPLDYTDDQQKVLKRISKLSKKLSHCGNLQAGFEQCVGQAYQDIQNRENSVTRGLIAKFGTGGEKQVAKLVIEKSAAVKAHHKTMRFKA